MRETTEARHLRCYVARHPNDLSSAVALQRIGQLRPQSLDHPRPPLKRKRKPENSPEIKPDTAQRSRTL